MLGRGICDRECLLRGAQGRFGLASLFGVHAEPLAYSAGSPSTLSGLVNRNIVKGKDFFRQFGSEPVDFSLLGLSEIEIKKSDLFRDVLIQPSGYTESGHEGQGLAGYLGLAIGARYRWAPGVEDHGFDSGDVSFAPNQGGIFTATATSATATTNLFTDPYTGQLFRGKSPIKPQAGEHFVDGDGLRHRIRFVTGTNISWICYCTPVAVAS